MAMQRSRPLGSGFTNPPVTKGRLTNIRTRYFREFMFNPTEVESDDEWQWGSHGVPGSSHRVLSGGFGAPRMISLSLYLDGDRGRAANRSRPGLSNAPQQTTQDAEQLTGNESFAGYRSEKNKSTSLDVSDEILFYQSFTYPVATRMGQLADRGPARVWFTYGPLFPGVECVVHHVGVKVVMWTPKLEPVRAIVSLQLEQFASAPVSAGTLFSEVAAGSPTTDNDIIDPDW